MTDLGDRRGRRRGPRARAALVAFGLLAVGCDPTAFLGPGVLGLLGAEPVSLLPPPPGFVLVVFQNETDTAARLTITVQTPNAPPQTLNIGPTITNPRFSGVGPGEVATRAIECDVNQVAAIAAEILIPVDVTVLQLQQVTNLIGVTQIPVPIQLNQAGFFQVQTAGTPTVDQPLCGSVVVFNLKGSLDIPERTFTDIVSGQRVTQPAFIQGVDPMFPLPTDFVLRVRIR